MSEIELNTIEPVIVMNRSLNSSSDEPVPSCSFQTAEIYPNVIVSDRKDQKPLSTERKLKMTQSAEYDHISIRSISDFDDSSSENNEDIENSSVNSQRLVDAPEMISNLLSKMTVSLPGAIARPNGSYQAPLLANQNSNTSGFRNVFIDGSGKVEIGDMTEATVSGDVVMNEIVYDGNEKCVKPNMNGTDHPKYKIINTVSNETERKNQCRWICVIFSIATLIATTYLLYLVSPKWIINSPNIDPDGLDIIIPRKNWSPNPMVKPLRNLSLPVEIIVISHTMTKNCTNRWDCATVVRSVQEREFNFLVGDDGTVFEGSGWNKKGSHTNHFYNKRSICFAFIGTYHYYPPSVRQINTVKKMIAKGVRLGNVMENYKLSAACQLAFSVGLGAALNNEIKNWTHYVGHIDKSNLMNYHNRDYNNQRQKRSTKRKKKAKSKPALKLRPSCYKASQ